MMCVHGNRKGGDFQSSVLGGDTKVGMFRLPMHAHPMEYHGDDGIIMDSRQLIYKKIAVSEGVCDM